MSGIIDPEVFSDVTNNCKPPKNFDFPKTEQFFRYAWFEKLP